MKSLFGQGVYEPLKLGVFGTVQELAVLSVVTWDLAWQMKTAGTTSWQTLLFDPMLIFQFPCFVQCSCVPRRQSSCFARIVSYLLCLCASPCALDDWAESRPSSCADARGRALVAAPWPLQRAFRSAPGGTWNSPCYPLRKRLREVPERMGRLPSAIQGWSESKSSWTYVGCWQKQSLRHASSSSPPLPSSSLPGRSCSFRG